MKKDKMRFGSNLFALAREPYPKSISLPLLRKRPLTNKNRIPMTSMYLPNKGERTSNTNWNMPKMMPT